jgi:hypothetical protein
MKNSEQWVPPKYNSKVFPLETTCYQPINGSATTFPEQVAADSQWLMSLVFYREYLYCADQVHGSALHGDQCAACHEAHVNFTDEWACLTADNVWSAAVTIHRSQEVLKMLSSLHIDIFLQLTVSLKNTGTTILLALTVHQTPTFTGWLQQLCCHSCTRLWCSSLLS